MGLTKLSASVACAGVVCFGGVLFAEVDPWAAPASYYAGVSGEGALLRSSLQSAMTSGHRQQQYGAFRQSAALHDADPSVPGNVLLVYTRQSIPGGWTGGSTWNREHVWPQSRQPGSASNSTRGNLGDPHSLRPCDPGVNSSRSNKPFGLTATSGVGRSIGTYWFPGDADKGDIARSLFYSSVRYGLALDGGVPSGNEMGDLSSLVAWHYADVPDAFERRRNHVIFSQDENPFYYTSNRNAFVDMPGAVWSVFVDSSNDSRLWLGAGAPDVDGGSSVLVDLGRGLAGEVPGMAAVALHRDGGDGVYYAVVGSGDAETDQPLSNGFTGAYGIGEGGSRALQVGIDAAALGGPGMYSGLVTVDNLDMTSGFGVGRGALDADDEITVVYDVVAGAEASFDASSVVGAVSVDVGVVGVGETVDVEVPVYALESVAGYTSGAVLDVSAASGDVAEVGLSVPVGVIEAGTSSSVIVTVTGAEAGPLTAEYVVSVSDDASVLGATGRGALVVTVSGDVGAACPLEFTGDGVLNFADLSAFVAVFFGDPADERLDVNGDGFANFGDLSAYVDLFFGDPLPAGC